MTVSINPAFPMVAPAASAASTPRPADNSAGGDDGKAASFGTMVDHAADDSDSRPAPSRPVKSDRPAKAAQSKSDSPAKSGSTASKDAASGKDDAATQAAPAETATADVAADTLAAAEETVPAIETVPAEDAGAALTPDPAATLGQNGAQAATPLAAKPMNMASHKAAAGKQAALALAEAAEPAAAADAAPAETTGTGDAKAGETTEPGKADDRAHSADADDQTVPLPILPQAGAQLAATAATTTTAQVALAGTPQAVAGNTADASEGKDAKGKVEGGPAVTLASAASARGPAKQAAFGATTEATGTSTSTGHAAGDATATTHDAGLAAADPAPANGSTLSAPVLSQTFAAAVSRPAALPYPAAAQNAAQSATVTVREGQFGTDMGVQIARALDKGGNDLLIKLDPRDMGRIDVRLSFDHQGVLRAVMSADSTTATDMLRRESTDLNRALADAGIRADSQSLRFDTRAGGQGMGQGTGQGNGQSGSQGGQRWQGQQAQSDGFSGGDDPAYRSLRSSGHVDLMA
ncbi:flagellar hook-length control protein FliK [Novosphingobium sp. PhB165]|uniref:flagellar hook-length control protein FliK n=1 Tax=Novosphingobium sp. PhB165 TaxID=2485105 RepID=UPI00104AE1D3|nr:flagellar hook-length control protein FliK [Novosphingobium sp. PhB165]TCM17748.1 flagellar hook-length control protein FliK [Novosphingobium sp. PhB165]